MQAIAQRLGFFPPSFEQGFQLSLAFRAAGPEGGKLHAPGRAVSTGARGFLDDLAPFGEGAPYMDDFCNPVRTTVQV